MNVKHTALPWEWWSSNSHYRLTGADGKDGGVISASIARDGMPVVNVHPDDAAFIVRACNAFDSMHLALAMVADTIPFQFMEPDTRKLVMDALDAASPK
jgi:hypothetical protein